MERADEAGAGARQALIEYTNIPATIGMVVSAGRATLHELDTVYSVADLFILIEIMSVDAHNQRIMDAAAKHQR